MLLVDRVRKVRSKNAGPYWVTVDIFCGDAAAYDDVKNSLSNPRVAGLFGCETEMLKRFEVDSLQVLKFSFPRPVVQGSHLDRDMHGAQYSVLVGELEL